MANPALTREEGWGLAISIAGHGALLAVLVLRPPSGDVVIPPERVEVTLSDEVGLTSTSPDPSTDARADVAPVIGEAQPPDLFEPVPLPEAAAMPEPRPRPRPSPRAAPRSEPRPAARQQPPPPRRQSRRAPPPAKRSGGSRIGSDFLAGTPGAQGTRRSTSPRAAQIGPRVRSALSGALTRQLKPHWTAPQGVDVEQIVTVLSWRLNRDGSLDGVPRVARQAGITDSNRPQAARHAEQAVRAVQLAAPFNLPDEYYDGWKRVAAFRFDKRLSQ